MRTHEAAKATSTPTSAIPPQHSGLLPLWESGESDRSLPSSESWLRSPSSPTPIHSSSVGHRFGTIAIGSPSSPVLQRKLAIGQPNDQYEQEADRVADQVMRMPAPKIQRLCPECKEELQRQPIEEEKKKEEEETLQTKPLAETITPLIQRQTEPTEEEKKKKEDEALQTKSLAETITPLIQRQTEPTEEEKKEEEETLQTKPASGEASTVSPALQNQITALQGGGQPLPESERHFFEPRFGADFSQVRVHADGQAAEAARAVNARAFTLGRDVVFGGGEYQPRSSEGSRLLAHELTHVVQQNGGVVQRAPANPIPSASTPSVPTVTPDQVVVTNNGQGVTANAIQVLKEIVASIGETSATITSGRRTPSEQAAAMYSNLESTGVAAQKALYGSNGDKVIDVYVAGKAAPPPKNAATIKQEMTAKIDELGPSTVSRHCSNNSVIDVAPSSITNDSQFATKAQAHAQVTKYLGPSTTPSDPAHHLEIA